MYLHGTTEINARASYCDSSQQEAYKRVELVIVHIYKAVYVKIEISLISAGHIM